MDLMAAAEEEVLARHRFFVRWYTGQAAGDDLDRSARLFAPDFRIVGPDGSETDGRAVVAELMQRRGLRPPQFAIRIQIRDSHMIGAHSALVLYDEHQSGDGPTTARRSSAIFSGAADLPEGVRWRHLHETWLA